MSMTCGTFIPMRIDAKNHRIGKNSYLMDAIADCLFEESRNGQPGDWLREGEKSGAITFEFSMDGTEYRVVRNFTKSGKATLAFNRRTESGDWEDCGDTTTQLTQAKIKQTLGMDAPDLLLHLRRSGGEKKSIQKTTIAAQVCALYEESRLLETLLKCMTNVVDDTDSSDILGAVRIASNLAERLTAGINAAIGTASQDLACSIYEMDIGETDMPLDEMNARLESTCKDLFKYRARIDILEREVDRCPADKPERASQSQNGQVTENHNQSERAESRDAPSAFLWSGGSKSEANIKQTRSKTKA